MARRKIRTSMNQTPPRALKARRASVGEKDIVDFAFASLSGTMGKTRIEKRNEIMKQYFLIKHPNLVLLDPKREFDYFEKVVIYRREKASANLAART